ncbi:MAG: putative oxidoreductase C-terminal domain-containing protein, partial [Mucilaginibacter sp.]
SHYAVLHGTKADLLIKQTAAEKYTPVLYINPVKNDAAFEQAINAQLKVIETKYPGVELKKEGKGYTVIIPEKYKDGHEAHFGRVTEKYLSFLRNGDMPKWEVPNMIAKYYITTTALDIAKKGK